jgi:hypothetical protein
MNSIDRVDDLLAGAIGSALVAEQVQDLRERGPAQVGHAQDLEIAIPEPVLGIQRHDIHVLQACQREVFLTAAGRDLQHDGPIAERRLGREEDPARHALAERGQQSKAGHGLPHLGKDDGGRADIDQALTIQQHDQLVAPAREPPRDLGRIDLQAGFAAEGNVLVDQSDRRLVIELGVAGQDVLDLGTLPPPPGRDQLLDLLGRL